MKTQPINYDKLYAEATNLFLKNSNTYNIDRKAENLAYLIALGTGLRVSDLLGLKYDNFQYNETLKKYCYTIKIQKTKSEHTSVISYDLYNTIQKYRSAVKCEYINENAYIFYNYNNDKLYTRQWLHKRIKIIAEKLNFKNCGVHSLRKASAIRVLNKSKSISLAQYHLGHKRASTTDIYLNISKNSALEQLSEIF